MLSRVGIRTFGAAVMSVAAVAALAGMGALAQDGESDTGIRAYLSIPFNGPKDKAPSRVGLQLLTTWNDDEGSLNRAFTPPQLESAVDLAFSRRGLAKFEVMGADARGTWNAAAQWLSIEVNVPEECETTYRCRRDALLLAGDLATLGAHGEASATVTGSLPERRLP